MTEKQLAKQLDSLFFRYVRLMADGYCKCCKERVGFKNLQSAHVFGRIRHTVRWNTKNVYALCSRCHYYLDLNPIKKANFLYEVLSSKEIEELERLANMTTKEYPIDKEALMAELKEKIKSLEE